MREEKARTVGTVVTVEFKQLYNVCGRYYFKKNSLLCTFICPLLPRFTLAGSQEGRDGPQVGRVSLATDQNSLRGLRAMIPSVLRLQS